MNASPSTDLVLQALDIEKSLGATNVLRRANLREDYDASAMAVVFQEFAFLPDLSVAENIHLPHRRDAFGRINSTRSGDRRAMTAICAKATSRIDVNHPLRIAAVDASTGAGFRAPAFSTVGNAMGI